MQVPARLNLPVRHAVNTMTRFGNQQPTRPIRVGFPAPPEPPRMSMREYYAGLAMSTLVGAESKDRYFFSDFEEVAELAVKHADALIAELAKPKE